MIVSPQWRKVVTHLAWYVGVVLVLAVLVFYMRSLLWLPWLVAVVWGAALIFLLRQEDETAQAEERLQSYLDQALAYKAEIDNVVKAAGRQADSTAPPPELAGRIDSWTEAIQTLVERIRTLQQDPLIRRDTRAVPAAIEELEERLSQESEPSIRAQLERTLENRRKQLASLEELRNVIARAEIQIESTLSMLGTIYSQILTGQSTSHVADYSRLSTDVDEEVRLLQDQLEALREVKLGREG